MPWLAELQAHVRDALVIGDTARVLPLLVGGRDPGKRLAVHQRHYRASLVEALLTRFPATVWLMGGDCVAEAARAFVHTHPPMAPCIAEFGAAFPDFLAQATGAEQAPYLRDFALLEWHIGHASVAVEQPALPLAALSAYSQDALPELQLRLQPGVFYMTAGWPVDGLIRVYLEDRAPDQFRMDAADIRLEVRGARGAFDMTRLDAGTFVFRSELRAGRPIGDAVEAALDADDAFEAGAALAAVMSEGLVTAVEALAKGQAE